MTDALTPAQQRQEEAKQQLADLLELHNEELSSWEVNFVESLSHWTGGFTYKQRCTIAKIHDEQGLS